MGLPCPFPWDVVELTHCFTDLGNLTATYPCSELCPASVMETPTQGFGWRSRAGEKKTHNKPGSFRGYWKVVSLLINHLGQEFKHWLCVGWGCFPYSYPHAIHALENDPFTIMHCCLATRAFPLSFPKWKHGSICFGDRFPWPSLLCSK